MNRQRITFFLAGLIAGMISVSFPWSGSPWLALLGLMFGGGPLFFVAVIAAILITGVWRHIRAELLHYLAGLILCTVSYFLAVIAFWWVGGLSSQWLGFRSSDSIGHFGFDIWLGLFAAGAVGASGITLFAALLTGKWSNALLRRLMLAGLLTICVTFIANLPFQRDWSFLGVLFPLGNALFCYFAGAHIWQHLKAERQVAATAPQPHQRPA